MKPNTLTQIIKNIEQSCHATESGTQMHARLHGVTIDGVNHRGDPELISRILSVSGLAKMFSPLSRTEVPVAGTICGKFISRRIDRLLIDKESKTIDILDYKTDTSRAMHYNEYVNQLNEYAALLHAIYPDYSISGYILWTHDFSLEKLSLKSL